MEAVIWGSAPRHENCRCRLEAWKNGESETVSTPFLYDRVGGFLNQVWRHQERLFGCGGAWFWSHAERGNVVANPFGAAMTYRKEGNYHYYMPSLLGGWPS